MNHRGFACGGNVSGRTQPEPRGGFPATESQSPVVHAWNISFFKENKTKQNKPELVVQACYFILGKLRQRTTRRRPT